MHATSVAPMTNSVEVLLEVRLTMWKCCRGSVELEMLEVVLVEMHVEVLEVVEVLVDVMKEVVSEVCWKYRTPDVAGVDFELPLLFVQADVGLVEAKVATLAVSRRQLRTLKGAGLIGSIGVRDRIKFKYCPLSTMPQSLTTTMVI
eukprot:34755-Amphidinium_carterae.1